MPSEDRPRYRCFLALPFSPEFSVVREAVSKGASEAGFKIVSPDQRPVLPGSTIREALIGELARADCIVADITDQNPNVYFELGLAQAMGKGLLIIANKRSMNRVPFDLREFLIIGYEDGAVALSELMRRVNASLSKYRQSPQRSPVVRGVMQHSGRSSSIGSGCNGARRKTFAANFSLKWGSNVSNGAK